MHCIFCGAELADGQKFCHICGKPVAVTEAAPVAEPVYQQVAEPVYQQVAEPVYQQVAEPVVEQAAEPVYQEEEGTALLSEEVAPMTIPELSGTMPVADPVMPEIPTPVAPVFETYDAPVDMTPKAQAEEPVYQPVEPMPVFTPQEPVMPMNSPAFEQPYMPVNNAVPGAAMQTPVMPGAPIMPKDGPKPSVPEELTYVNKKGKVFKNKPICSWGYVGYRILFGLPIIGFIASLIMSFACKNINTRNNARGALIIHIIWIVIFAILFALITLLWEALMEDAVFSLFYEIISELM